MHKYELFGIEVFSWDDWDDFGEETLFYSTKWKYPSMQRFNSYDVYVGNDGILRIEKTDNTSNDEGIFEVIEEVEMLISDIPEWRQLLMEKYS